MWPDNFGMTPQVSEQPAASRRKNYGRAKCRGGKSSRFKDGIFGGEKKLFFSIPRARRTTPALQSFFPA